MITLTGITQVAVGLAVAAALWWFVDLIGDQREAAVWARINSAIAKTNADTRAANSLDDKIAAVQEDARQKALASIQGLTGCVLNQEQAAGLNRVK